MPDDSNRVGLTELAQVLDLPVEEIEDYTVEPCMVNGVMRLRFVVWLRGNTDTCPQCGSLALIRNGYLTRHLNHHICFGRDWCYAPLCISHFLEKTAHYISQLPEGGEM